MTGFLRIANDDLSVEVSPIGAALARVWLKNHPTSLVTGLATPGDYAHTDHFMGVIVGPVAGRIAGARAIVAGRTCHLDANTPPDTLHSGPDGIQNAEWAVTEHAQTRVTLRTALPDGACGLPGNRMFTAAYALDGRTLSLDIETTSDADTLVSATGHAYWALDDLGDLSTHDLQVATTRIAETGADLIPTGRVVDLVGKDHDFSTPKPPVAGKPLDGCFCLSNAQVDAPRHVMHLRSRVSGITLDVETDQPGLVLYTGEYLPALGAPPDTPPIRPFSALAIETQAWPGAAHHGDFPSILLEKGRVTLQRTRFIFSPP